ncbi:hypothetical protein ALP99_01828, partial [Pseudomonas syringae pv. tomato]
MRNEISTIVRRSASHAVPDAPRPLDDAERRDLHSHAGACGTRYQLSCGAPRRMPFRTLRVLLATQSVETCIPKPERAERDINYRAKLRVACRSGRSASHA